MKWAFIVANTAAKVIHVRLTTEAYAVRFLDALRQDAAPPSASTTAPTSSTDTIGRLRPRCVAELNRI
jgi:hypothetical protein